MPTIHFTDQEFENLFSFYAAKIDAAQRYVDKINPILSQLKRAQKRQTIKQELTVMTTAKPAIEPTKKRGRPKNVRIQVINKEVLIKAGSKRRGRPPKASAEQPNPAVTGDGLKELISQKIVEPLVQQAKQAKKRGRPPKIKNAEPIVTAAPKPKRKSRNYGHVRRKGRIYLANLWKPLPKKSI